MDLVLSFRLIPDIVKDFFIILLSQFLFSIDIYLALKINLKSLSDHSKIYLVLTYFLYEKYVSILTNLKVFFSIDSSNFTSFLWFDAVEELLTILWLAKFPNWYDTVLLIRRN